MTLTTSAKVVFIHWKYFWRYSFYLWWTSLSLFTVSIEWVDIWYYFNLCKLIDLFDTINFYTSTPMKRLRMINPSTEHTSVLYDAKSINDETRNICRVKSQFICCVFVRRYKPRKVCVEKTKDAHTTCKEREKNTLQNILAGDLPQNLWFWIDDDDDIDIDMIKPFFSFPPSPPSFSLVCDTYTTVSQRIRC